MELDPNFIKQFDTIMAHVQEKGKILFDAFDTAEMHRSSKQNSEDVSGLWDSAIEKFVPGAIAPKKESQPDIIFGNGMKFEIKASAGTSWRGGSLSKREGYFCFINYEILPDNTLIFFCAGLQMLKSDWIMPGSNYYATTYGKKHIFAKGDRVDYFAGNITPTYKKNSTTLAVNLSAKPIIIDQAYIVQPKPQLVKPNTTKKVYIVEQKVGFDVLF